jgi:hypothetical protein
VFLQSSTKAGGKKKLKPMLMCRLNQVLTNHLQEKKYEIALLGSIDTKESWCKKRKDEFEHQPQVELKRSTAGEKTDDSEQYVAP